MVRLPRPEGEEHRAGPAVQGHPPVAVPLGDVELQRVGHLKVAVGEDLPDVKPHQLRDPQPAVDAQFKNTAVPLPVAVGIRVLEVSPHAGDLFRCERSRLHTLIMAAHSP